MATNLPQHADVVIVGGGIAGCSIAYHLAKLGITDVLLLERKQLTCGTTWHAAGLVGQLRATPNLIKLARYTTDLFSQLQDETGQETGFKQNGSISIATTAARFEELKRGASMGRRCGLETEIWKPEQVLEHYPELNIHDVVGAVWLPGDGQTNPIDTTQALAKGARMNGAKIVENLKVTGIKTKNGKVCGVETEQGDISADVVVLTAGMWSREFAKQAGVSVPLHACEHFYIVTEPIPDLPSDLPVLRDPDNYAYYKEDAGKILLGAFEPNAKPWGMEGISESFSFDTLPEDFDHFEDVLVRALARFPRLEEVGIQLFFNGPESFTPDVRYMLGEAPELENMFIATGFNSIGIQSSGGVGKVMAEWIRDRHPPMDLADVDIRRLMPFQSNKSYMRDRVSESLGLLYADHWPFRQAETARGIRRSPFHQHLIDANACMGETAGWERPNWFAPAGVKPEYDYAWGRQNWFDYCANECLATRDHVALYDQTSFAKYLVQGRDALTLLNRISTADIDVKKDQVVYTQWLNHNGGIESDVTITRIAEEIFMVVTAGGAQTRDLTWLMRHLKHGNYNAIVTDITSGLPMLGLMGPKSRPFMELLTGEDFSNDAFPFYTSREVEIGYAKVRASRLSYVGELGWEIYVPTEFTAHVFETIQAAGTEFNLTNAGMHAMNSCRQEKGFRHWGHDIADEDTPLDAGLAFTIAWDKKENFIGKDALLAQRQQYQSNGQLPRRMVQIALKDNHEDTPMLYHEEPLIMNGKEVGAITSGMWGHRIGKSIGMGYISHPDGVNPQLLKSETFEVEVAMERYPIDIQLGSLYDPKHEKMHS